MMADGRDVDETILDLANSLVHKTNGAPMVSGRQAILHIDDVPELFVKLFEFITSEDIQHDVHDVNNPEDVAITLQMIIDTLEEIMNVPLSHITGLGLVTLNRRQLYDALQIFNGLLSCISEEAPVKGLINLENGDVNRDSSNTSLKQFNAPSARMETIYQAPQGYGRAVKSRLGQNLGRENTNSKKQLQGKLGPAAKKQPPTRKANSEKNKSHEASFRRKPLSNIGNTSRGNFVGTENIARKGNNDRKMSVEDDVFASSIRCRRPLSNSGTSTTQRGVRDGPKNGKGVKKGFVNGDGSTSNVRPRKYSVISTKVKRHGSNSPDEFKRTVRLRRGDLSPQTVSMCSSLKLLEEFDFLKRRYKEIQEEIKVLMVRVRELHDEELRIEHVLSHVQQRAKSTKKRKNSRIQRLESRVR